MDECASEPCLNGATCFQDAPGTYRCSCAQGFTGPRCEQDIDECASRPCANGGSCTNGAQPATFSCACSPGFMGPTCEGALDLCKDRPCLNNGQCNQNQPGTYQCVCPGGFRGERRAVSFSSFVFCGGDFIAFSLTR